jgi:phosphohistidine phosphatase
VASGDRGQHRIHLVRHAHAGDPLKWEGPDAMRPLSRKGRRQAAALGALLGAAGVHPDRLVTSPKVRARETADIIGAALGVAPVLDDRLTDDCDLRELEDIVTHTGAREVMVVGHDPYLSELFSVLVGGDRLAMPKGAIATIDVERPLRPGTGSLCWFVPPSIVPASAED